MHQVLWFQECDHSLSSKVGGKNASLGEMIKAGIPVPPGFAVATDAYSLFLAKGGIEDQIQGVLFGLDPNDLAALDTASNTVRQLMDSIPMPEETEEAIHASYGSLAKKCALPHVPVAVRSSATAEDLPGASFAGQQETFLWIRSPEEVSWHVKRCWSSLFTARAISYRITKGFPHEKVRMSVGVQKMVNAKVAGVAFTLNPSNGDLSKIGIEANWGLGETVVMGEVTPDRFMVDKVTMEIVDRVVSLKLVECIVDHGGDKVKYVDLPPDRQNVPCLTDQEIREVARLAKVIERHYGRPQDIEWAIEKDEPFPNLMIVQSRPETLWSQRPAEPVREPKEKAADHVVETLLGGRLSRK